MSTIMILSLQKHSGTGHLSFIILLSSYGILQNALNGSARSIEKEKYQSTLSFHFLSGIALVSLVMNKLIANIAVGIINLCLILLLFFLFFPVTIYDYIFLTLGFLLLLIISFTFSFALSAIYFKMRSPYVMSALLVKVVLLTTGILLPLEVIPKSLVLIFSLTGIPQAFSLIIYGLNGSWNIDWHFMFVLPIGIVFQVSFAVYRYWIAEKEYLNFGGI